MERGEHRPRTVLDEITIPKVDRQTIPIHIFQIEASQTYAEIKKTAPERETLIDVSEGFQPFGPPSIYTGEVGRSYPEYDTGLAESYLRERYRLGPDSEIVFGSMGSNEILERIFLSFKDDTTIWGIGPHFPEAVKSIQVARRSKYIPIDRDLYLPYEEVLTRMAKKKAKKKHLPSAIYLANPDASGDFVEKEKLAKFIDIITAQGTIVILDNALADFMSDSESAADLTSSNSYLFVTGSLSKAVGIPGEGLSYLIAHKSYAEEYRSQMRAHHYRGPSLNLFNDIMRKDVIDPHLAWVREGTTELKMKLLAALSTNDIKYLPTSIHTPTVIIDGEDDLFWDDLDLPSTPGSGYSTTFDRVSFGIDLKTFSNRYARIGLPILDYNDPNLDVDQVIATIVKRIVGAKHVADAIRRQIRTQPLRSV